MLSNLLAFSPGEAIVTLAQQWIGPILLLVIAIIAIGFLVNRQILQFVIFIIIAILVAFVFYYPGVIRGLADVFFADSGFDDAGVTT